MEWNGMDGPPVAFAVAVAVAPASPSRPPVAQSSASEDGTQTEETGVGLVRWILADESDPDLSRISPPGRTQPPPTSIQTSEKGVQPIRVGPYPLTKHTARVTAR